MKKTKVKIFLYLVGTLMSCCMLTGCHRSHEWVEATCTTPKTCSVCGATEGEALGHKWEEAICTAPKTCSVCGATEGEALGHTLTEANYQQAATCTVCGETAGEALSPEFVEFGAKGQFMELNKAYDYVTVCSSDVSCPTVGQATVTKYEIFASDDVHEAKKGYEWQTVEIKIVYSDENALRYGAKASWGGADYYDFIAEDDFLTGDNTTEWTFTVNFNGEDYTECRGSYTLDVGDWTEDNTLIFTIAYEYLLPVDYDGRLIVLYDSSFSVPVTGRDDLHLYDVVNDDTLYFRLDLSEVTDMSDAQSDVQSEITGTTLDGENAVGADANAGSTYVDPADSGEGVWTDDGYVEYADPDNSNDNGGIYTGDDAWMNDLPPLDGPLDPGNTGSGSGATGQAPDASGVLAEGAF